GIVVEEAAVDDLYNNPTHPYTRELLACLPGTSDAEQHRLPSIVGTPPDPAERPPGCPFEPRCRSRIARCATEVPPLTAVAGEIRRHRVACWLNTSEKEQSL